MNECLLVCLCYHFVIFADSIWSRELRENVGTSTVVFVVSLLGINTLIITALNIKAISLKCKRRKALKEHKKWMAMSDQQRYKADLIKKKAEAYKIKTDSGAAPDAAKSSSQSQSSESNSVSQIEEEKGAAVNALTVPQNQPNGLARMNSSYYNNPNDPNDHLSPFVSSEEEDNLESFVAEDYQPDLIQAKTKPPSQLLPPPGVHQINGLTEAMIRRPPTYNTI